VYEAFETSPDFFLCPTLEGDLPLLHFFFILFSRFVKGEIFLLPDSIGLPPPRVLKRISDSSFFMTIGFP